MRKLPWYGRIVLLGGILGLPLLLGGCGSRTQPVDGLVVFPGGEPATQLQGYMVGFTSTEESPPVGAVGVVESDGTFTVGTYATGDGAVLGKHQVHLFVPGLAESYLLAPKYRDPRTSGLEVTIVRGRNKVVLEVEPNQPGKR